MSYSKSCEGDFFFPSHFYVGVFFDLFFDSMEFVVGEVVPNVLPFIFGVGVDVSFQICVWNLEVLVNRVVVGSFGCCVG